MRSLGRVGSVEGLGAFGASKANEEWGGDYDYEGEGEGEEENGRTNGGRLRCDWDSLKALCGTAPTDHTTQCQERWFGRVTV